MSPAFTPWTDDKVEELKRLWAAGYSATQIAQELRIGVTRMSVLGKVNRIGLSRRKEERPREPKEVRPRRRPVFIAPRKERPMEAPSIVPEIAQPKPRRLTLLQLAEHHCRWPVEGPPVFRFCGAHRASGDPYCRYHMGKSLQHPRQR